MSDPDQLLDADFDAQLRGLFAQAEESIESRTGTSGTAKKEKSAEEEEITVAPAPAPYPPKPAASAAPSVQSLQQVARDLEALSRVAGENAAILKKLESGQSTSSEAQNALPKIVADLRGLLESKQGVNQSMFAALHEELKGYKDSFLLESVHRPVIRDLISLYDDIAEIHRQLGDALSEAEGASKSKLGDAGRALVGKLQNTQVNMGHNLGFILEVLNRLDVVEMESNRGKLDKQMQRAVSVESADAAAEDGDIVRVIKCGFLWRERVFRPEEVVIKKWKEGVLVEKPANDQK
jgi:molecular chaperone GrpE (heat shock protein)